MQRAAFPCPKLLMPMPEKLWRLSSRSLQALPRGAEFCAPATRADSTGHEQTVNKLSTPAVFFAQAREMFVRQALHRGVACHPNRACMQRAVAHLQKVAKPAVGVIRTSFDLELPGLLGTGTLPL